MSSITIYSDFNPYDLTKGNLTNIAALRESVTNILGTAPRELLNNPEFALTFDDLLFDIMDDATALAVAQRINRVIRRWDSRLSLNLQKSVFTPIPDDNKLEMFLVITAEGLGEFDMTAEISD